MLDSDVDIFTIAKNPDTIFGLTPLDGEPPLSPGDIQLCKMITK